MKKKRIASSIIFIVIFIIELVSAIYNYSKLSHLNKYGITKQAVVDSFNLEKRHTPKGGTFYTAEINYHIQNSTEQEICIFKHYPSVDYAKGSEFAIIIDYENDFKLPSIEIEAYKRNKVTGKIVAIGICIFCIYITAILEHRSKKHQNKNKYIKKMKKKDPEFKAKMEKKEDTQVKVMLILLAPFLFIMGCYYEIKNRITAKKKNKKK